MYKMAFSYDGMNINIGGKKRTKKDIKRDIEIVESEISRKKCKKHALASDIDHLRNDKKDLQKELQSLYRIKYDHFNIGGSISKSHPWGVTDYRGFCVAWCRSEKEARLLAEALEKDVC